MARTKNAWGGGGRNAPQREKQGRGRAAQTAAPPRSGCQSPARSKRSQSGATRSLQTGTGTCSPPRTPRSRQPARQGKGGGGSHRGGDRQQQAYHHGASEKNREKQSRAAAPPTSGRRRDDASQAVGRTTGGEQRPSRQDRDAETTLSHPRRCRPCCESEPICNWQATGTHQLTISRSLLNHNRSKS